MILLIIKSYLTILLVIGISSLSILLVGLYWIFKKPSSAIANVQTPVNESHDDFAAIAGDDRIATQLDLARAYIETGKNDLAKSILSMVAKQGNTAQQEEAEQLMIQV